MRKVIWGFLLAFCSQQLFGQALLDQKFDFYAQGSTLEEALQTLNATHGLSIAYSSDFLPASQRLNLDFQQTKLKKILARMLRGTKLEYKLIDDRIILSKKKNRRYSISGYLEDAENGERLISARVYCPKQKKGCISNEYGFYSLNLEEGEHEIEFHYVGYQSQKRRVILRKNSQISVGLQYNLILPEVVISPKSIDSPLPVENHDQSIEIGKTYVASLPSLGGQVDHVRAAHLLPGVQGGIDGLGGMYVRGGESGQNLMLLDGVPVYVPFHLLGAYSIYNSSSIQSAKFLKGNFSARYGGRISSVYDIRTREGNKNKWAAEASFNLINGKALVEGPIKKEKGSFLLTGRVSYNDVLLNPSLERIYFQEDQGNLSGNFFDLNAKINYKFGKKDHVHLSFFTGQDLFYRNFELTGIEPDNVSYESDVDFRWNNSIAALRWNHLFGPKLFANFTLTHSNFRYEYYSLDQSFVANSGETDDFYFLGSSSFNNSTGASIDFDYIPNSRHTLRFGGGFSLKSFLPDITYVDQESRVVNENDSLYIGYFNDFIVSELYGALEAHAYLEDHVVLSPYWDMRLGLRASAFFSGSAGFKNLEPRFLLTFTPAKDLQYHFSINRMFQYIHLINSSFIRLPNDIWLPSTENIEPQEAWQAELGVRHEVNTNLKLSGDLYFKNMKNLYAYPSEFTFLEEINFRNPEGSIVRGKGNSYGLELSLDFVEKNRGAKFSYSLTYSNRWYEGQNLNLRYPFEYDSRHQVKFFLFQKLGKHFQLGLNGVFNSPNPRQGLLINPENQNLISFNLNLPGKKNFLRSKSYHRLDANIRYQHLGKRSIHTMTAGVYNLYDQRNIAYYSLDFSSSGAIQGKPVYALPFLPSFSYSIKF